MNIIFKKILFISFLTLAFSRCAPGGNENTQILIQTSLGDIKIRLYDETPIHRDNFIKLVKAGVYDGISFHRVINKFMIQSGDPKTNPDYKAGSNDTLTQYTIPAEFNKLFFHKKGALAAARRGNDVNPEMRSSGTQFYIVQGETYTDSELDQAGQRINGNIKQGIFNNLIKQTADSISSSGAIPNADIVQEIASTKMFQYLSENDDFKFTPEQREVYKTLGGTPRLDATYTVFGEVTEGLDIVDKIAAVPTDNTDKPLTDIQITKMKILRK